MGKNKKKKESSNLDLRIKRAKVHLMDRFPFIAYLVSYLDIVERTDPEIESAATDGVHIFYNPEFFAGLSDSDMEFVLAHEVMHCVLRHISRGAMKNRQLWNFAADAAANYYLKDAGFDVPEDCVLFMEYGNLPAEEIYYRLSEKLEVLKIYVVIDDHGLWGKHGTGRELGKEWRDRSIQARQFAKSRGDVPKGIDLYIEDELLAPKIPWQAILYRFLSQFDYDDWSFRKPNKKYLPDVILPTLCESQRSTVGIAIDTSGSISRLELQRFLSEIKGIASQFPDTDYVVYACDCEIQSSIELARTSVQQLMRTIRVKLKGGGGTDFRPVFESLKDHRVDALVYFTDGYGVFPEKPPPYPVLWALSHSVETPFGERVMIEVDN
jgi:predicted metal-dependent peptidase